MATSSHFKLDKENKYWKRRKKAIKEKGKKGEWKKIWMNGEKEEGGE